MLINDFANGGLGSISDSVLADLESRVQRTLRGADLATTLEVIGYGDTSVVLGCETGGRRRFACKRLPPFGYGDDLRRYRALLTRYIVELRARGVSVIDTNLQVIRCGPAEWIAYCVQPAVDRCAILTQYLSVCTETEARQKLDRLLEIILSVISERLGLDADVSNWCLLDGDLTLVDITPPLLRNEELKEEINVELFLASLPRIVQRILKSGRVQLITNKFYCPRGVLLDVLCGLYRERVPRHVHYLIARANGVVDPPITLKELRLYCLLNETVFSGFRKLQRIERFWRRFSGNSYPFLLPPGNAFSGRFGRLPLPKPVDPSSESGRKNALL